MGEIAEMYREHELWDSFIAEGERLAEERCLRVFLERAEARIWTQKSGTPIAVKDMTDAHLLASLRMLRRKGFIGPRTLAAYMGPGPTADMASFAFEQAQREVFYAPVSPFVDYFEDEIKRRRERL